MNKLWIYMIVLLLAVTGLCVWDTIHTKQVFKTLESKSNFIYESVVSTEITDQTLKTEIEELNSFWTKKMDTLCISISRKDLQPISDYLQYLYASTLNESQEDAITYARLLMYNVKGLKESTGVTFLNLL